MDTISTIVGPSITLSCPLVGSSLALRLGPIFEIEPALRQCLTIKWWYAILLLLRY